MRIIHDIIFCTKGVNVMYNRRPLNAIFDVIRKEIKDKNWSILRFADEAQKRGFDKITRGKVQRTFWPEQGANSYINHLDDYIECALTIIGLTTDDVLNKVIQTDRRGIPKDLLDVIEWSRRPEALPYLKLAHAQFKLDEAKREAEQVKKEIEELNKK